MYKYDKPHPRNFFHHAEDEKCSKIKHFLNRKRFFVLIFRETQLTNKNLTNNLSDNPRSPGAKIASYSRKIDQALSLSLLQFFFLAHNWRTAKNPKNTCDLRSYNPIKSIASFNRKMYRCTDREWNPGRAFRVFRGSTVPMTWIPHDFSPRPRSLVRLNRRRVCDIIAWTSGFS